MHFCGSLMCSVVWQVFLLLPLADLDFWGSSFSVRAVQPTRTVLDSHRKNLPRQKRNWVWNQFFVLEEYTGADPLYVGKVKYDTFSFTSLLVLLHQE